jgi:hypothetical protein
VFLSLLALVQFRLTRRHSRKLTNTEPLRLNRNGITLHASPSTYWRFVRARTPHAFTVGLPIVAGTLFTSIAALFYSRLHPDDVITLLGLSVGGGIAIVIAMLVYLQVYLLTARIQVDSSQLVRTAWFSRPRAYLIKDISRVSKRSIELMGMRQPGFLVENAQGLPLFWLLASRWDNSEVDRLWGKIGVIPTGSWSDKVDYYAYSDVPRW